MKYTLDESRDWYNQLPAKRSSAAMILRRDNTVLLVKDDYKEAMSLPGGVVDPGESPLAAAVREAFEEVKLELAPDSVRFFTMAYVPERNGFLDRYQFFFTGEVLSNVPQVILEEGIEYYEWVPIESMTEKAGGRATYAGLQHMLESGEVQPYFEVTNKGDAIWRS